MAPVSRATFVKDIRAMIESFCKRSSSVLYNVILTTSYAFYSTKCVTVNTLPFNWYVEGSVMGGENVPKLSAHAYKLQLKINITQQILVQMMLL